MKLSIGPAKYEAGFITFNVYASGETALIVMDDKGEYQTRATVSLDVYGVKHLPLGEVWLKGWSENTGIPEALVAAGIVELTGNTYPCGFTYAVHARLTERAMAAMNQQLYGATSAQQEVRI